MPAVAGSVATTRIATSPQTGGAAACAFLIGTPGNAPPLGEGGLGTTPAGRPKPPPPSPPPPGVFFGLPHPQCPATVRCSLQDHQSTCAQRIDQSQTQLRDRRRGACGDRERANSAVHPISEGYSSAHPRRPREVGAKTWLTLCQSRRASRKST